MPNLFEEAAKDPKGPTAAAFIQHQGNIYWLDVQAQPHDANAVFGWKTSIDHFNDDASFSNIPFGAPPVVWDDMIYPPTHPFHGQSIDLAFALTTVPEPGSAAAIGAGALICLTSIRRRQR